MKKEIFKYSVVKKEENTEDSLIEQSGGTVKFTLKSIVEEIGLYNKKKQEIDAKKQLSQSVIENIKENNPGTGFCQLIYHFDMNVSFPGPSTKMV